MEFFGLFHVPAPVAIDPGLRDAPDWVHRWNAWLIMGAIAMHAAAALFHHFVLRDGTLRRMAG